jgi:hypothetical protein
VKPEAEEYRQQQAGCSGEFGEPLTWTGAHVGGELEKRQLEHRVRQNRPGDTADDLRQHICRKIGRR